MASTAQASPSRTAADDRVPPPALTAAARNGPAAVLAGMSEAQRVGQLFMVGGRATGVSSSTVADIQTYHAGSVILYGDSSAGVGGVHSVTAALQSLATPAATAGVPLLIATDQEGGLVQELTGPGFSTIPSALVQGTYSVGQLQTYAWNWGSQLAAAGVQLNLAPVMDTVPPAYVDTNPPIGELQREYGNDPGTVASHGGAFLEGMHAAGIGETLKHYPGLGRVSANTDTAANVVDSVTGRHDPLLQPFYDGVRAGAPFVMVSLATYNLIDPSHVAAFSPTVVQGMLRGDDQFLGVVVSDSLNAAAVSNFSPGQRAVNFLEAGGDLILVVDPTLVPQMATAVLSAAQSNASFANLVDQAALKVLVAKQQLGLLGGDVSVTSPSAGTATAVQRANDNSAQSWSFNGSSWSGPVNLGGHLIAAPAVAWRPGTAVSEVAALGTDRAIWVQSIGAGQPPGRWQSLGGRGTSAPAIAAGAGQIYVGVRGSDDALWLDSWTSSRGWTGWQSLGGLLEDAPALAVTPAGDVVAAITGLNQQTYLRVHSGTGWSSWRSLGGESLAAPGLAVDPSGTVTVFVRGSDAAVWENVGGSWIWLGGRVLSQPAATSLGSRSAIVLAEGTDGIVWQRMEVAGSWAGWVQAGF